MGKELLVGVHWNSRKKCWSVVDFKSRKVIGLLNSHLESLILSDVSFKVDKTKKKLALGKGSKDRHTFIVGIFSGYPASYDFDNPENNFDNKIKYHVKDNDEPFKDSYGNSVLGKTLYFRKDGKVFVIGDDE